MGNQGEDIGRVNFVEMPRYCLLPKGYHWQKIRRNMVERTSKKIIDTVNKQLLIRPIPGTQSITFGQPTRIGCVKVFKDRVYVGGTKHSTDRFYIKHYIDWQVGICQRKDGTKSFVFPLDPNDFNELQLHNVGVNISARFRSWAEVTSCEVLLITEYSKTYQRERFNEFIYAGISSDIAELNMPIKTTFRINKSEIINSQITLEGGSYALGNNSKKTLERYF